jgi:hypothetical protein
MSITFAYPTIAAPTTSIVLDDIEGFPHTRPWRLFQSAFDTDAATQVVYDHGDPYQAVPLTLYPLTTGQSNALVKFCKNTVKGRALSFEIRDTAGDIYPVNFAQDVIDPMMTNIGIWSINIILRVVSRISQYLVYIPLENNLDLVAGSGVVTYTRSTIGTYIEDGIVKTAAINTPRFETNGLLMEGASTNQLTYSEQFDTVWSKTLCSIAPNDITAPDGTTTADKLVEGDQLGEHFVRQVVTVAADSKITVSVFAKAEGRNYLHIGGYNGSAFPSANFDIVAGVVGPAESGVTSAIQALADGWYKCSITYTMASGTEARAYIYPNNTNDTSPNYQGDGSSGIYIWGAQLEELPFVTSYIPTTASAITRTTDFCSIQFSGNHPSIQKGNPFSYIVDADAENVSAPTRTILTAGYVYAGINDFSLLIIDNSTTNVSYYRSNSGVGFPGADLDSLTRYGVTIDNDQLVTTYLDGVPIESSTHNLADDTGVDNIEIGIGCRASGGGVLYGHIKNVRIYDVALHETEIRFA